MEALRHHLISLGAGLFALAPALLATSPVFAGDKWTPLGKGWERYTNERFGTVADVPRHVFRLIEPPTANGDGREFRANDGAGLWISGSFGPSVVTDTFQEYKAWLLKHTDLDRVTYKVEGKNWLVLSGTKGTSIVYRKVVEGCGAAHEIQIKYPAQKEARYDPVVARLSHSLSCNAQRP